MVSTGAVVAKRGRTGGKEGGGRTNGGGTTRNERDGDTVSVTLPLSIITN